MLLRRGLGGECGMLPPLNDIFAKILPHPRRKASPQEDGLGTTSNALSRFLTRIVTG
jgi:hypothetical protein